jgi:hypothetical protein
VVENFVDLAISDINRGYALCNSDGEGSRCSDCVARVVFVVYQRDGERKIYETRRGSEVRCDSESSVSLNCYPIHDVVI